MGGPDGIEHRPSLKASTGSWRAALDADGETATGSVQDACGAAMTSCSTPEASLVPHKDAQVAVAGVEASQQHGVDTIGA